MLKTLVLIFAMVIPVYLSGQQAYVNITSFGMLQGTSSDQHQSALSFISEHHYMFLKRLSAGFVTGIEQLNENTMPVAAGIRYFQPAGRAKFIFSTVSGYSVSLEKPGFSGYYDPSVKKAKGGFLAGMEAGVMIPVNDCAAIMIGIGYRHSKLHYDLSDNWIGQYQRNHTFNRTSLRIGIILL